MDRRKRKVNTLSEKAVWLCFTSLLPKCLTKTCRSLICHLWAFRIRAASSMCLVFLGIGSQKVKKEKTKWKVTGLKAESWGGQILNNTVSLTVFWRLLVISTPPNLHTSVLEILHGTLKASVACKRCEEYSDENYISLHNYQVNENTTCAESLSWWITMTPLNCCCVLLWMAQANKFPRLLFEKKKALSERSTQCTPCECFHHKSFTCC